MAFRWARASTLPTISKMLYLRHLAEDCANRCDCSHGRIRDCHLVIQEVAKPSERRFLRLPCRVVFRYRFSLSERELRGVGTS
jgi:hypothetical protein